MFLPADTKFPPPSGGNRETRPAAQARGGPEISLGMRPYFGKKYNVTLVIFEERSFMKISHFGLKEISRICLRKLPQCARSGGDIASHQDARRPGNPPSKRRSNRDTLVGCSTILAMPVRAGRGRGAPPGCRTAKRTRNAANRLELNRYDSNVVVDPGLWFVGIGCLCSTWRPQDRANQLYGRQGQQRQAGEECRDRLAPGGQGRKTEGRRTGAKNPRRR